MHYALVFVDYWSFLGPSSTHHLLLTSFSLPISVFFTYITLSMVVLFMHLSDLPFPIIFPGFDYEFTDKHKHHIAHQYPYIPKEKS